MRLPGRYQRVIVEIWQKVCMDINTSEPHRTSSTSLHRNFFFSAPERTGRKNRSIYAHSDVTQEIADDVHLRHERRLRRYVRSNR